MNHDAASLARLEAIARLIRHHSFTMSSRAGSGHPTSSMSATELMTALLFGGVFRYDLKRPDHPNNDRLIFSKGHASPLYYSMWAAAGAVSEEELQSYRQFGSVLEGHPTPHFRYAEAATGSLGQGLAIGVGIALNAQRLDRLPYRTYILLGDSEMAEGSQWEAMELASYYRLNSLTGILDMNRLGQRGETMLGRNAAAYAQRAQSFGWETKIIDGHALPDVLSAYEQAAQAREKPFLIIANTIKGKGVSFLEDAEKRHGTVLGPEELPRALAELGPVDLSVRGEIALPEDLHPASPTASSEIPPLKYERGEDVATRKAYGTGLVRIHERHPQIVSLDGEVSNSTGAETFKKAAPDRFFEMFIAEQAMAGVALGLSSRGKVPFASTFSAFWSRAFDQIRMSEYSEANVKFVGSHAGVSIGEDGPSQMGLEDIALFRVILDSVVLHPCDAVSTEKLVEEAARHRGIVYLRTLRQNTPVIYDNEETFPIGGSKILRQSEDDVVTVVAVGGTVPEALQAHRQLAAEGIAMRVIDAYSVKPLDRATLLQAAQATGALITVEDHYAQGGLGEAVLASLADQPVPVTVLAVRKRPMSGKAKELRDYEAISAGAIVAAVKAAASKLAVRR